MATGLQPESAGGGEEGGGIGRRSLIIALVLVLGIMIAEIIGGLLSGSLVLLADAGHMLATASAIAIALFVAWAESRPASIERTFGYHRAEVIGSMLSALALWLVAAWALFESISRLRDRSELEIEGGLMLVIGAIGLGGNIIAALVLRWAGRRSERAGDALRHLLADLLASVGVVFAAVLVLVNGWTVVDPIVSIGVAALTAASSWRLILQVFHTLLEGTPEHIDLYQLCADIEDVPGVTLIHDVHAWSISDNNDAFTAHVVLEPGYSGNTEELLSNMRRLIYEKHGVRHLTLQLEESASECFEDHHLSHLEARSRFDG
jgi:cobalt-zinc-cadmium efflux system protein